MIQRLSILCALTLALAAFVTAPPAAAFQDQRVRLVTYDPGAVVELAAAPGFVVTIMLRDDEEITAVAAGDTRAWEILPAGDRKALFVKPLGDDSGRANLTVITSKRSYAFLLETRPSLAYTPDELTLVVRFHYPVETARELAALARAEEQITPAGAGVSGVPPEGWNFNYTYRGSEDLRPLRAFDDGTRTYFEFPEHVRQPAIFAVDGNGAERLVNYDVRGRYYVVHALGRQFTMRDGPVQTCVYNKSYPTDVHGPLAPALEEQARFRAQDGG